jgi:hypothetical protein
MVAESMLLIFYKIAGDRRHSHRLGRVFGQVYPRDPQIWSYCHIEKIELDSMRAGK